MREASFYTPVEGGKIQCLLCPHACRIPVGGKGVCGVRENRNGVLFTLVYGRVIAEHVDPIEKKPLFHFLPGTLSYSIATVGCNFRCKHCQNADISQYPRMMEEAREIEEDEEKVEKEELPGKQRTPEEIVVAAIYTKCSSIAYTYTEPTIFMEYALDVAKIAKESGLKNVFVSNGYTTKRALKEAIAYIDAFNIDLKAFSDEFYQEICGAHLQPVLDTLSFLKENKKWVEVTTLLIPGFNDNKEELEQLVSFIADELGTETPWHVSRFHPDYQRLDVPPTPLKKIEEAIAIGKKAGLKYIYAGNVWHTENENTFCPNCKRPLIIREGFSIIENRVKDGECPYCHEPIAGVWG